MTYVVLAFKFDCLPPKSNVKVALNKNAMFEKVDRPG